MYTFYILYTIRGGVKLHFEHFGVFPSALWEYILKCNHLISDIVTQNIEKFRFFFAKTGRIVSTRAFGAGDYEYIPILYVDPAPQNLKS